MLSRFSKSSKDEQTANTEDIAMPPWAKRLFDRLYDLRDDLEDISQKIEALETKVAEIAEVANAPTTELEGVKSQLHESSKFMQQLVLELVKSKPAEPAATPSSAVANYLARKNGDATRPKLP